MNEKQRADISIMINLTLKLTIPSAEITFFFNFFISNLSNTI